MRLPALLLLLILLCPPASAGRAADTMTGTFDENIRSLRVHPDGNEFAPPIIVAGTPDRIYISFDHFGDDREFFRYSLTHCTASWQPDGLTDSEFLDGFNEGTVDSFDFSRSTLKPYVHYWLTIPNEQVRPTISGNYLLRIYRENDPDSTLLQCRFMITEATAPVDARVTSRTDVDYNNAHQQLSIAVNTEHAAVDDRFNDLLVVVGQNGRLDSEVALRQPLRASAASVIYEHQPQLIFDAGNEYRRFETVSDTYPGMGVEAIQFSDPYYNFFLTPDVPRTDAPYSYDQTQHGRYVVRRQNSDDNDTEAEYVVVHFTLDMPEQPGAMIFLDGDFVNRRFDDSSRVFFNYQTDRYERSMLLKQGSYNYQYLIVPPGARRGYTAAIEGDKYETVNEYLIRVYHRRRGDRYDRLIGSALVRSDM